MGRNGIEMRKQRKKQEHERKKKNKVESEISKKWSGTSTVEIPNPNDTILSDSSYPYNRNSEEQSLLDSIGTDALGLCIADVNYTLQTGKRSVKRREREERQRTFQRPQKGKKVVRWHDLCCVFGSIHVRSIPPLSLYLHQRESSYIHPRRQRNSPGHFRRHCFCFYFYFSHDATDA